MNYSTPWARKTAALIQSGEPLAEPIIRKMRTLIGRALLAERFPHITGTPSCTSSDAWELCALLEKHAPHVTPEQARKGATWLHAAVFTPRGILRRTDLAREFGETDREVIADLQASPRFRLVEFDTEEPRHGVPPVYRAIGRRYWFDYVAASWQSGARPYVLRRGEV